MKKRNKARKKPIVVGYRKPIPSGEAFRKKEGWFKVEWINTLEGRTYARPDRDYVIKGVHGEIYPIKIDIFNDTFDVIEEFSCPHWDDCQTYAEGVMDSSACDCASCSIRPSIPTRAQEDPT